MVIKIYDCETKEETRYIPRTKDISTGILRAVRARYGSRAGFWRDPSIRVDARSDFTVYGQITEPAKTGGYDCLTGRVRIEIYR